MVAVLNKSVFENFIAKTSKDGVDSQSLKASISRTLAAKKSGRSGQLASEEVRLL